MVKIDNSLIYLRSENARMSLKELSQHLKKSPQRLKYALSTLEKEAILSDPFCIFDYSYFGVILFRVYFRGAYISEQDKQKVLKELKAHPYVVAIYELSGEFDLTVEFASPNPSKFNKELKKLCRAIPTLNDYKIILNLVTYVCPRRYLCGSDQLLNLNTERIVGGDRERETFDDNETIVVKHLLNDPVVRFTKLEEASGLNVKTVKSIIKNLMKRNIIKGFKYNLDTNKLGIHKTRLFLRLHNVSTERESQLMDFILKTKEIVQINKTVGDWDMELDLESLDKSRIRLIIRQLREDFKDLIESFNSIEFYSTYKRTYLPIYLMIPEPATPSPS